jgi:hypothetical protein
VFAAGGARDASTVSAVSERGPAVRTGRGRDALAPTPRLVRALVQAGLAVALLTAPLLGWIHVHKAVTSARLSPAEAAAAGARDAGVDPAVFDRLTRIIPAHATYWVDVAPRLRSSDLVNTVPLWASGALLPRLAVARPEEADWIVTWGYSPKGLGVGVRGVRVLRARTALRLPVYVAQVVR